MEIDDSVGFVPPTKRFKHQSYNESLKDVHLPSTFKQSHLEHEVGDNESHFHEALDHWRQLNLAPSFIQFANKADGLSASLPLLLHNWREIYTLWEEALKVADDEGLRALLDLLQKMAHDLRTTLTPIYGSVLDHLLGLLPKAISAPALTFLLETLSSLFRYLLIPAVDSKLLEDTWTRMCKILPKCLGEIQRAIAEVWGGVLRRMKAGPREKAVLLIAHSTVGVEDASAWILVYACKSVSQTLHTCAPSIFEPLLSYHLTEVVDPRPTHTLLRRTLTALVHHVKNAEQFSSVGEMLVQRLAIVRQEEDEERLRRMLEVLAVATSVRQGSRITDEQKMTLYTDLAALPVTASLHTTLLRYVTSLFFAGEMSLWLGPGLKYLQRSWTLPPATADDPFSQTPLSFALKLHLCLADVNWGGWKLIALPVLIRSTAKPDLGLVDREQRRLISFLAALVRGGKLGTPTELDVSWKTKVENVIIARLTSGAWKTGSTDEVIVELDDILVLLPLCAHPMAELLVGIVESYMSTFNNPSQTKDSARIIGLCMQAISRRPAVEWASKINVSQWARTGLRHWSWSHDFISGVVAIAHASPVTQTLPLVEIYPSLYEAFLSHSRPLRLAALRLLDSKLVDPTHDQIEVLKRCLQGEEVPLDIQGVRERVLRIGRVGQVVGDEKGADLCARWLIAQLKVNLRPLWSPSASALASLGKRFGDLVWRLLFEELKKVTLRHSLSDDAEISQSSGMATDETQEARAQKDQENSNEADPSEEERSWRDPSAHRIRSAVLVWDDPEGEQKRLAKENSTDERFDLASYEQQLLVTLGECHDIAEKHNRELIPHFLALNGNSTASVSSSALPKPKLLAWLNLFAKFSNPKALFSTDSLRTLYTTLLSHPDRPLQSVALSCLFTYKSPQLIAHEEQLRALLDDTRWRDELSLLDLKNIPAASRAEFMDVFIRLLFGIMLEKKGRGRGGGGGGADRRAAVLSTFTGCTDHELGLVVDLMLRPFGWNHTSPSYGASNGFKFELIDEEASDKQVLGFLTLLGDVLKNIGSRLVCYWPSLLGMTINITGSAQSRVDHSIEEAIDDKEGEDKEGEDKEGEDEADSLREVEDSGNPASSKITRSIRQLGLKRFADFFRIPVMFDFSPYMSAAFTSCINPRLPALDRENTQAPSALMELFYTWTIDGVHIPLLVELNTDTLPKIYDCLIATNVKPSVVSRIFDIVENLLSCSSEDDFARDHVLKPYVSRLLTNLAILVERTKGQNVISSPMGQRQITILSEIAQYSTNSEQATTLLALFNPLLRRPAKIVPEKVKQGLVKIIGELMHLIPEMNDTASTVYQKTYGLLSQLFQSLRSRHARVALVATFYRLATLDNTLTELAELLDGMNAYSIKRIDEPDFDRRLDSFASLNERQFKSLTNSQWLPILYNMLNFIQDPVELAVRNSASYAMRHFIDVVAAQASHAHEDTFLKVLYPGLKNGLRSRNELVRTEILGVIAYAVERCIHIDSLQEMRTLLEGGDEEANFFNNILHIQVHRRSRALRRLGDHCDEGHLRSATLADIFVPLVANYVMSTSTVDHHLVNDAIQATGRMAKQLQWGSYYSLVQKYLKLSRIKDESEKVYIRTLVAILDNFHFPMDEVVVETDADEEKAVLDDDEAGDVDIAVMETEKVSIQDARKIAHIADAVNLRLLPSLLTHLEKHDANTDDNTRIPISIGIVKVAMHLPTASRDSQVTRLLTILSQILRSRSQETRDLVRDSLNRIAVTLGSTYLPLILREMRAALLRGPQLHVLAFATHSLILHITTGDHSSRFTNLDDCVNDVAYVSAEVIFGESGKDVQAEDFKTKMREVRASSSRGLDSFAIMAKFVTPPKISSLLIPVKKIMQETDSVKTLGLVDEVLKRISSGLNSNGHLIPAELIVLCNTLVAQNAKFLQQTVAQRKKNVKGDAIVQIKRQTVNDIDHYASNSFRFVAFGLELLNTALKRNRFDFHDTTVVSRLDAMVVVVGNTLYSTNATVLIIAMRCAAGLAKCPLKAVAKSLPVTVRQILDIIKQTGNTESELVQVAFKCIGAILRDGPPVQVKEKDLVYLIELLTPDLEDPERQASVFTLLRAIVARKFVVPEIYDLMEKVSEVAVTSQSTQVQELCRGVLLQFLLDYPQGKGRLRNQMAFFAKNLSYIHESGRTSIMELLSAVIVKFQANLIQEYSDLLFVALVMVLANDDSAKCREMAGQLIKNLWARLEEASRNTLLSHLHSWATQTAQPLLTWVSVQVYGFIVDVAQKDSESYIQSILDDLDVSLKHSAATIQAVEEDEAFAMDVELDWQLAYHSLTVLAKIVRVFPQFATEDAKIKWPLVVEHLLFPHAWVRTAACRLLGLLFNAVPVALPQSDSPPEHPLSRVGMQDTARKLTQQLKSEHLDQALSLQIVKNLFYLGKCFYLIPITNTTALTEDAQDLLENEATSAVAEPPTQGDDPKELSSPLPWLFSKISYQIKSGHIARRSRAASKPNWSQQPLGGLRWFAAMASHMEGSRLEQFLVHILTPVYRITEDDTIRDSQMDELKATAVELQDLAQTKVGTTKFATVYNQIRQSVLGLRRERKTARVLQATTNPEASAKRKMQRNVIKKDSRKRKERGFLEVKGKFKRRREE